MELLCKPLKIYRITAVRYLAAVKSLTAELLAGGLSEEEAHEIVQATFGDTAAATWGLQAVKADVSLCSGAGIRVAVLDTGFDLNHPDFAGRSIITASFVPGETVQDGHSHGTHCIGTACGSKVVPGGARSYGVAGQTTILAGKVLSNGGSGQGGWIISGINWAVQQKAVIISMSLGSNVPVGGGFSPAYEQAGLAALNAGSLIVAAAGNNGNGSPVGSPANCPSFMAVGALNQSLQLANFSCTAINAGQTVDIAAPGVATYSSVPMPGRYGSKSGTSMATPHVAGCAALWAQNTGLRGRALWNKLTATTRNISLPPNQVGAGLVQAPSCKSIINWPPGKILDPVRPPLTPIRPVIPRPPVPAPINATTPRAKKSAKTSKK
jgi:subtilisin family serine protease